MVDVRPLPGQPHWTATLDSRRALAPVTPIARRATTEAQAFAAANQPANETQRGRARHSALPALDIASARHFGVGKCTAATDGCASVIALRAIGVTGASARRLMGDCGFYRSLTGRRTWVLRIVRRALRRACRSVRRCLALGESPRLGRSHAPSAARPR